MNKLTFSLAAAALAGGLGVAVAAVDDPGSDDDMPTTSDSSALKSKDDRRTTSDTRTSLDSSSTVNDRDAAFNDRSSTTNDRDIALNDRSNTSSDKTSVRIMDTNADGTISKKEYLAQHEALYDRMQKNQNGTVDVSDLNARETGMVDGARN